MSIKTFRFPDLIYEYEKSLTKDLRERKSLDDILDLWLPSEDIYLSFNTFLEAIIYSKAPLHLEFVCIFEKRYFNLTLLEKEIKKFSNNYEHKIQLEDSKNIEIIFQIINKNLDIDNDLKTYFSLKNNESFKIIEKNKEQAGLIPKLTKFKKKKDYKYLYLKKSIKVTNKKIKIFNFQLDCLFQEDILKDASFSGEISTKDDEEISYLIDLLIRHSINKPFREIADHSISDIFYEELYQNQDKTKIGILTIKNNEYKIFDDVNNILRSYLIDFYGNKNFIDDYKNINEFFEEPPQEWLNLNPEQMIDMVKSEILNLKKKVNYINESDLQVVGIKKNLFNFPIRIEIQFDKNFNMDLKPKIMRQLEDIFNQKFNYKFDFIVQMFKDKSVLRRNIDL